MDYKYYHHKTIKRLTAVHIYGDHHGEYYLLCVNGIGLGDGKLFTPSELIEMGYTPTNPKVKDGKNTLLTYRESVLHEAIQYFSKGFGVSFEHDSRLQKVTIDGLNRLKQNPPTDKKKVSFCCECAKLEHEANEELKQTHSILQAVKDIKKCIHDDCEGSWYIEDEKVKKILFDLIQTNYIIKSIKV